MSVVFPTTTVRPYPEGPSTSSSLLPAEPPPPLQKPLQRVRSHYRPISSILADSEPPCVQPKRLRHSLVRPLSTSGLQSLAAMGFGLKDRMKDKNQTKDKDQLTNDKDQALFKKTLGRIDSRFNRPAPVRALTVVGVHNPQESAPRILHRVKKKRSLASLFSPEDALSSGSLEMSPCSPFVTPTSAIEMNRTFSNSSRQERRRTLYHHDDEDDKNIFRPKNNWIKRNNQKLHPYTGDAPYMQSYDPVLLENDRYTDSLLRLLNKTGSPSFHDYGKKPPATVLDLGCGQGHWIIEAAQAWKQSQITGFDLVDVCLPAFEMNENIYLARGNFLKYPLPFPEKTFEFVRIANLSLCIPHDKWEFVLSECRRVLTIGGRLELIDDQILFPYLKPVSPPSPYTASKSKSSFFNFDDEDDCIISGERAADSDTDVTLIDEGSIQPGIATENRCRNQIKEIPTENRCPSELETNTSTPIPRDAPDTDPLDVPATIRLSTWDRQAAASRNLETIFRNMLVTKFGIHPCPSELLPELLVSIFGENSGQFEAFQINLAPAEMSTCSGSDISSCSSGRGSTDGHSDKEETKSSAQSSETSLGVPFTAKKTWMSIEWDSREKRRERCKDSSQTSQWHSAESITQLPSNISEKAAGRLGIASSALAAASAASSRRHKRLSINPRPAQSPGLYLSPSTFIPMSPHEVEMHACKHIHTLLGCKTALQQFIAAHTDECGVPFVEESEFLDALWDYECFRRTRFNWPFDLPESYPRDNSQIEAPPLKTASVSSTSSNSSTSTCSTDSLDSTCLYGRSGQLTHIRTIYVYEAIKKND